MSQLKNWGIYFASRKRRLKYIAFRMCIPVELTNSDLGRPMYSFTWIRFSLPHVCRQFKLICSKKDKKIVLLLFKLAKLRMKVQCTLKWATCLFGEDLNKRNQQCELKYNWSIDRNQILHIRTLASQTCYVSMKKTRNEFELENKLVENDFRFIRPSLTPDTKMEILFRKV